MAQVTDYNPFMYTKRFLSLAFALTLCLLLLALTGCMSRPASAQKLFDAGEYQKVIDKYPDLEIARRAHAKLADQILQKKDYSTVMREYADTPAAYRARIELAQKLFDEGRYQAILDSFPSSPVAAQAKAKLADSLLTTGQIDKLLAWYPDTPQAKQVKEEQAQTELAKIQKMPRKDKKQALEDFMKKYTGTETYKAAADQLAKIRDAETNQANKKK